MRPDIAAVAVSGTWLRHVPAAGNPTYLPHPPASGRWQRGEAIGAVYLTGDEPTCWAEWYRRLAEDGVAPDDALPRDLWRFAVALDGVAALDTPERLQRADLPAPTPDRAQWPAYQRLGEELFQQGFAGVLYPSAARPEGCALCVFRPGLALPGMRPLPPPVRHPRAPVPPRGLRT